MLLYPEAQAKAQAELDAVIGDDRLPQFEDRERLPYVNALVLEVLRWHTVAPTGQYMSGFSDPNTHYNLAPRRSSLPYRGCYSIRLFHSQGFLDCGQHLV